MDRTAQGYRHLTERFVQWAQAQQGVRMALVVGSRARAGSRPADEWSDLDIVMLVTDPEHYLTGADWIGEIGKAWLTFIEPTGAGQGLERRVLFEGGFDVDFACFPVEAIHQLAASPHAAEILGRGATVLLDKDGLGELLQVPPPQPPRPPSQEEYLQLVSDFIYHAVWTAKKLRRGELWTAKGCSDNYMKRQLLRMVEWHARGREGLDYDVWHEGRFLEQWASPRVLRELENAFASYHREDLWRGLFATMDLFRWLAMETAQELGLSYPTGADVEVTSLVQKLFSERS